MVLISVIMEAKVAKWEQIVAQLAKLDQQVNPWLKGVNFPQIDINSLKVAFGMILCHI